jgi:hypothetical protein
MNKHDLINELNDEYRSLLELVQDFGKEDFEKPGAAGPWTTRDVFAHLAFWNGEAKKAFVLALRGERPEPWLPENLDEINTREAAARRALPLHKVMDDFRRSHRELVAQLDAAPERKLEREMDHKTPDGSSANAGWVIASSIEHLRAHGEAMDIWLHSAA